MEGIKKVREASKKRNFVQSFDLSVNLKNIDLKRPENRIKGEVVLPHPVGNRTIGFFADSLAPKLEGKKNVIVIRKSQLEKMGKKDAKKLAKKCHVFLAEAPLMPIIGKNLGQVLGPRNKLPKPVPPGTANIDSLINTAERTVKISVKTSPVVHCIVGKENMKDEEIAENIKTAVKTIETLLPRGREQIKSIFLKLTMGPAVEIKVI
ncbi:MAG: 50S ribosomal protein L1 [Candidatus Micrarchaeota archaeon]|nr:50S ribosomal protein L1 [Candidatus Micrarchaeota archaeon]